MNRRIGVRRDGVLVRGFIYGNLLHPLAELDPQNNVVSRFVYGPASSAPEYMVKGGVTYRIISDHLGSVRLVVNVTTGAIVQQIDYDEYGQITQNTNPGFQPFGYAAGLVDDDTRLVHFGAREYDPYTGRWTSKDPASFRGGDSNLYTYAGRDPVNYVDPSGLARFCSRPLDPWGMFGMGGAFTGAVTSLALATSVLSPFNLAALHEQVFFDDGCDWGFLGKQGAGIDPKFSMEDYTYCEDKEYDDELMYEALDRLKPKLGKYNLLNNNCQDAAQRLRQEYNKLVLEQSGFPIRPDQTATNPYKP
jgi:RHS repeat-associated protein